MFRSFVAATLLVVCGLALSRAEADSYLFDRSYYSHAAAKPVVIGHRAPTGGPQFTRPQGAAVTSCDRYQRSQIRVGGQVVDQLIYWDSWFQVQGKR